MTDKTLPVYIKPELSGVHLLHFDRVDSIIKSAADAQSELREQLDPAMNRE